MLITTDELIIRDFKKKDAEAFYEFAKNDNVGPNCNWEPHPSLRYTKQVIKLYRRKKDTFAICLENGSLIGTLQVVNYYLRDETYEIGYCIAPEYWNKGYATLACYEIIRYYFSYVRCNTFVALTKVENHASMRVLEKLGFEYEGILKNCKKDIYAKYIDVKSFSLNRYDFERNVKL